MLRRVESKAIFQGKLEWCPDADLNHGHADFQSNPNEPTSVAYSENSVKPQVEYQSLSGDLSNPESIIEQASHWLYEQRDCRPANAISELRARFGLRAMDAVEASKRAHALQYVRAL